MKHYHYQFSCIPELYQPPFSDKASTKLRLLLVGGTVKGDCIECPFHQWQFRGEDGECTHVPYDKPPKGAKLKSYTAGSEWGSVVLVRLRRVRTFLAHGTCR